MSKFLPTGIIKWVCPKELNSKKYSNISPKDCVLEVDLKYSKESWELHNYYLLAPGKTEIKGEMLSNYQLKIVEFYYIPIDSAKKLVPNFFDKEKYVLYYKNL